MCIIISCIKSYLQIMIKESPKVLVIIVAFHEYLIGKGSVSSWGDCNQCNIYSGKFWKMLTYVNVGQPNLKICKCKCWSVFMQICNGLIDRSAAWPQMLFTVSRAWLLMLLNIANIYMSISMCFFCGGCENDVDVTDCTWTFHTSDKME